MPGADVAARGDLPDINVWLALLNPQHPHHSAAKNYWEQTAAQPIAFCRVTMLGLLRRSTNKAVMGGTPYSAEQAWQAYQAVIDLPEVVIIAEPPGVDALMRKHTAQSTFRQPGWTDAYLAAFAHLAGLRMVSFDRAAMRRAGLEQLLLR